MTSLFIVTSAIYTSFGKYSTEERIEQTRDTFRSIETYAPNSSIVLLDCGEKSIDQNLFNYEIIDYTIHSEMQNNLKEFLKNNKDIKPEIIIKSMLETMMVEDYLKTHSMNSYKRVFKLSGRYKLNSKFDYLKHLEAKNKVAILPPIPSYHLYNLNAKTVGLSLYQYMTRLWSFDSKMHESILLTYKKIKEDIVYASKTEKEADLEHLMYKHLNKKNITHLKPIGVEGFWSHIGDWIEE